jgi:uncharacterized membrane protein/protein-disulfide isomerase
VLWLIGMFTLIFLAIISGIPPHGFTISFLFITLLKLAGLCVTIILLTYDFDNENGIVENICSNRTKDGKGCSSVLESKGSTIFGIKWADIGFIYFAASFLVWLVSSLNISTRFAVISYANVIVLPFILYSIYYQWRVVKKWCALCLLTQSVLIFEFITCYFVFWQSNSGIVDSVSALIMVIVLCIFSPTIAWLGLKPILKQRQYSSLYRAAYNRLQYNPDIFQSLLKLQNKVDTGWQDLGIDLGNPEANNTVVKVCQPYCGPCSKAHPKLEELIKVNQNVKLKIIFTTTNKDKSAVVVKHLLAIAGEGNAKKTQEALDRWYLAEKKDYNSFASSYPLNDALKNNSYQLEAMSEWCKKNEIFATPTIFVNGYRIPDNYDIEQLKNIL